MPGEGEGLRWGGQAINLGPYPDTAWDFHGGSRGVFPLVAGGGRIVLREGGQAGRGRQEGEIGAGRQGSVGSVVGVAKSLQVYSGSGMRRMSLPGRHMAS
jgi:hypothetical protein